MGSDDTREYLRTCSICGRKVQRHTSALSLNTWTTGWHRSFRLCGNCTRLVNEFISEAKQRVFGA